MNLSQAQLEELRQIVADHHSALIVNTISPEALPKETVDRLKAAGLYKPDVESIRDAYLTGVVTSQLPAQGETMSYAQLKARLKANPIPLSRAEQQAVKVAELSAGQYITALGQRVAAQAGTMVMQADTQARAEDLGIIRTEVSRAVRTRRSIKQLKSDLGHATKDWARDLERVANTEMSTALQQGVALAGSAREGDKTRAAKRFAPNCCDQCKRLFSEAGTQVPKIFLLSELVANGTNVGRKAKDWLPVVGPVHPNCGCSLVIVPAGMSYTANGDLLPDDDTP